MRALRFLPILLLAACGQAGDLYLPPEPADAAPAPADTPPDPDKDEDEDKK